MYSCYAVSEGGGERYCIDRIRVIAAVFEGCRNSSSSERAAYDGRDKEEQRWEPSFNQDCGEDVQLMGVRYGLAEEI